MAAGSGSFPRCWFIYISLVINQCCDLHKVLIKLNRVSVKYYVKLPLIAAQYLWHHLDDNLPLLIGFGFKTALAGLLLTGVLRLILFGVSIYRQEKVSEKNSNYGY